MELLIAVVSAVAVGSTVVLVVLRQQRTGTDAVVADLRRQLEDQRDTSVRSAIDTLVAVAREQLGAHTEAGTAALDSRNELMDQRIDAMHGELDRVVALVQQLERDRQRKFGELSEQLATTGRSTAELAKVTQSLREALASPQARGQWGERMADDVLRAAGFVEGVNYLRQASIGSGRPDFTFLIPGGRVLHMDVKFPLDNYLRHLEATSDVERETHVKAFVRDVKNRVKELSGRDYIDPAAGTLDHVLLFIPNEHVYAFVHERDRSLLDLALGQRVVLCSPLTLFSVLSVIRQAADNLALERTSGEILDCLAAFGKQWQRFVERMDKLGDRIDATRKEYDDLATTRRRQLERQLDRIEDLRAQRGEEHEEGRLIALPAEEATGS